MKKRLSLFILSCLIIGTIHTNAQSIMVGAAPNGGSSSYGTVFSFLTGGTSIGALVNIPGGVSGATPMGSVTKGPNGKFYATVNAGGANSLGGIYEINPDFSGSVLKVSFNGVANGSSPTGTLYLALDGNFYGMTTTGGSNNYGEIFKYVPGTTSVTVMHSFTGADGSAPKGSFAEAGGKLWGLTSTGGSNGYGVVFSYDYGVNSYTIVNSLTTLSGSGPVNSFVVAQDGNLYATCKSGGSNSYGSIVEVTQPGGVVTFRYNFLNNVTSGGNPEGNLVPLNATTMLGMTPTGGQYGYGCIYSFNTGTGVLTILYSFQNTITDGGGPKGALTFSSQTSKFYGLTSTGGANSYGTGFEFDPAGPTFIKKFDIANPGGTNIQGITLLEYLPLSATITPAPATCNGSCNGSATVTPTGGTPPYTYSWAPSGGTTATASSLCAGTYTCTITEAGGSTFNIPTTITQPSAITSSIGSQTNVSCNGGNNGSATVTAGGGTPGYTYNWAPIGGTGTTGTGLMAGTSTCTITDSHGCTKTQTATITQPTVLTSSISSQTNVSCNGGSNGSATVLAGGGTPGYTYSWAPSGGTTTTAVGLTPATYTCTITDSHGCTKTQTATITEPTILNASFASQTNVSCSGGINGTATASASGGTAGYLYNWIPIGGTANTASGLSAGSYTCTVTDANSCIAQTIFTINEPTALASTISNIFNVLCYGGNSGSADINVTGGSAPYSYSWSPTGGNSMAGTFLYAGTSTCTVTDANGCWLIDSATITEPPPLTLGTGGTNVTCFGLNDGTAGTTPSGGTPPYTYSWSPGGAGTPFISALSPGTYTVSVTDANACNASDFFTITEPTAITATVSSVTPATCAGYMDGNATIAANGGTPTYTYSWAPLGGSGATTGSLGHGTYTCTVTDANGCIAIDSAIITEPTNLVTGISGSDPTCNGGSDGTATITLTGGTLPYSYSWAPFGGTATTATGLTAGNFTCSVTDAHGCIASDFAILGEPTAITANASQTNIPDCAGTATGIADVTVGGGTFPYFYSWSSGGTTSTESNLAAGSYTCSVTDNNGCLASAPVTITTASNTDLMGNVTFSSPITTGYAYAFKQQSSTNGIDTVDIVPVIAGSPATYTFSGLNADNYYIKVILDTATMPTAVPTYYGDHFQWDSSLVKVHGCLQTDTANINVIEVLPPGGPGVVSGYIIEGVGFTSLKMISGVNPPNLPFVPGGPIRGVDVKLGKNPGGGVAARMTTDTTGFFQFTNIPIGTYKLYVDIPNLPMDSIRDVTISAGAPNSVQNNYIADSVYIYIDTTVVTVGINSAGTIDESIHVYPNPNNGEFFIKAKSEGSYSIVNEFGQTLQILKASAENNYTMRIADLNSGIYFIIGNSKNGTSRKKVIVTR